jgi:hypothetical protein
VLQLDLEFCYGILQLHGLEVVVAHVKADEIGLFV